MKKTSVVLTTVRYAVVALALVASMTGVAFAKDNVVVSAKPGVGPVPVIVNNGQAVGTIQLFYTVNASEFPVGQFATFTLDWNVTSPGGKQATQYGSGYTFSLEQDQQGGHVDLVPSPDSFLLTSAGQTGQSTITVFIGNDKDGNPPSNVDGTELVGNLKLDAGSKVGTVSNIQVHIRLVHSTNCIRVFNFVTDQDFNIGILDAANVGAIKNGPNAGNVNSSQPGQFSDNVLVANVCATPHSFDLKVMLDPNFSTNPVNNPGNAVFVYTGAGAFDLSSYGALLGQAKVGYQQNLCLQNLTVAPDSSLLMTVHSKLVDGLTTATLPADKKFRFEASLYQNINQNCSGPIDALATPNPASFVLPFTVNGN